MIILDNVTVADTFPTDGQMGGAQLFPVWNSSGGYFNVLTNNVYCQLAYSNVPGGGQGETHWTLPAPFPVGPGILAPGTVGIRFRNYTSGSAAVVSAALSERGEPPLTITSGGVAATNAAAVVAGSGTLTWPGASPQSNTLNVTHGLGTTPRAVVAVCSNPVSGLAQDPIAFITAVGLTTFSIVGITNDLSSPAGGSTSGFNWIAT